MPFIRLPVLKLTYYNLLGQSDDMVKRDRYRRGDVISPPFFASDEGLKKVSRMSENYSTQYNTVTVERWGKKKGL